MSYAKRKCIIKYGNGLIRSNNGFFNLYWFRDYCWFTNQIIYMKDIQMLRTMPKEQRIALRNMFLTFIASLIIQSFFK